MDTVAVNSAAAGSGRRTSSATRASTSSCTSTDNPYNYVEIRGKRDRRPAKAPTSTSTLLTKKYIGQDEYPFRQPGEERVKFVIAPDHVRHQKQG